MAMNDLDFLTAHDCAPTESNLALVARVRAAGRYLRNRAYGRWLTSDRTDRAQADWRQHIIASERFERDMIARRIG